MRDFRPSESSHAIVFASVHLWPLVTKFHQENHLDALMPDLLLSSPVSAPIVTKRFKTFRTSSSSMDRPMGPDRRYVILLRVRHNLIAQICRSWLRSPANVEPRDSDNNNQGNTNRKGKEKVQD